MSIARHDQTAILSQAVEHGDTTISPKQEAALGAGLDDRRNAPVGGRSDRGRFGLGKIFAAGENDADGGEYRKRFDNFALDRRGKLAKRFEKRSDDNLRRAHRARVSGR